MCNWSNFECNATKFLNDNYSNSKVYFEHEGGSNSNVSDIKVIVDGKITSYVESKMNLAQSGQFVLLLEDSSFVFSPKNKSKLNDSSKFILDYINYNFDYFKNVGTNSLSIDLSPETFNDWIINHYKNKGVKFIITTTFDNQYLLFPIEDFGKYFTVTANFRRKKSGSANLPKSYDIIVENYFKDMLSKQNLNYKIFRDGSKCFIHIDGFNSFSKYKFPLNEKSTGYLSDKGLNLYEIKKLSNTNNPNVIFSIEYNGFIDTKNKFQEYIDTLIK